MKQRLTILFWLMLSAIFAHGQTCQFFGSNYLSSTMITSICQDQAGYIWVATENGLHRFDGYRFTVYRNNPEDSTSLMYNIVNKVFCDKGGNLWVGTNTGLQRYDYATDRFVRYDFSNSQRPRVGDICQDTDGRVLVGTSGYSLHQATLDSLTTTELSDYRVNDRDGYFEHIYVDARGNFWKGGIAHVTLKAPGKKAQGFPTNGEPPLGFATMGNRVLVLTRDRLLVYDEKGLHDGFFDLSPLGGLTPNFTTALCDHLGNIYIGTRGNGVLRIPVGTRRVEPYHLSVPGINADASKVWALLEDRQGNLWVGCQRKGLVVVSSHEAQFSTWSFSAQKRDIGSFVSSICRGENAVTWCTVQNEGVYGFNSEGTIVAHPSAPGGTEFISRDRQGNYYLGTSKAVYSYDPVTGRASELLRFGCDKFNCMADDGHGHLYFSAYSRGMLQYDKATRQLRHFQMTDPMDSVRGKMWNDWVMDMTVDRDGRLWLASSWGVSCYDPVADSFRPFGWNTICERIRCESICETRDGDMIIGTLEGLYVWRRKTNTVEDFPNAEPLRGLTIAYIVQDNDGGIWCATSMGIWHYRQGENKWLNYVSGEAQAVKDYVSAAGMFTPAANRIYFATGDGIVTFTPQQVDNVVTKPGSVRLSNLFLGSQRVSTLTESGGRRVTDVPVIEGDHFTVSYLETSITLEFSLLNFSALNTIFEYRVNGASEWTRNIEGQNAIVFNHLPSGTYRIEVRAIDNGVVSESRVFTLVVTPPWYRSTLAYIIYALALAALILLGGWLYRRRMRQRLDEDKMKFLINATHDIRSPLTLIMGPLDKLRRRGLDAEAQEDLGVIERNAQRILSLVNQILDVRKIDKQQMHLHCRETDMAEFVRTIYQVFEYTARERGIDYTFDAPTESVKAWIDRTQFDKVVSNLLSNAFKYGSDNGEISLHLTTGHDDHAHGALKDYVELTVADIGTGMRDETLLHLFDRFYQGAGEKSGNVLGTGIGLNLCKMIVDMHHGTITGRNRTDGQRGSVFTVRLPLGTAHLDQAELDTSEETPQSVRLSTGRQPSTTFRVLIVDDDEELARFVAQELASYYYFAMSHNGKDGLKELLTNDYDLVISDVMMPEMDGFTMLRMIRTNVNISHLPVIMLTSKSDIGNRLEGLEKGADAYLTKPFNVSELHATIDNLIATRLRLRGKFSGSQKPIDKVKQIEVKGNDEQLMERIIKSVNDHLSDSDFGVDTICQDAGISRAHLHRKMKEMTGIPVSEFIRNIRMEQAARLLKEQKLNITQVAYTVGFSSLPYFSAVFRKHFGISPREFIVQQTEGGE